MAYILIIINALRAADSYFLYLYNPGTSFKDGVVLPCLHDPSLLITWSGSTANMCLLEVLIFFGYQFTMAILLLKSRLTSIGVDQSSQFEPKYMSFMI